MKTLFSAVAALVFSLTSIGAATVDLDGSTSAIAAASTDNSLRA